VTTPRLLIRAPTEGEPDLVDPGVCEFGELLAEFMTATPDCAGAVLSDGVDDTIDTAHRPALITALDLEIAGAQIGQAMTRLTTDGIIFGLGRAQIVLEGANFMLVSKLLWEQYLVTAVLDPRANIARAMRNFDAITARILALLKG